MDALLTVAERILSERWEGRVRLREGDEFRTRKSVVLRCAVVEAPGAAPGCGTERAPAHSAATVIVKQVQEELTGPRYDPESADPRNPAQGLLTDWASLQFLCDLGSEPPLAPRFLGGDRLEGVIVLEDLGTDAGSSVHDLLHGDDPAPAEEALVEYTTALGRLHAASLGRAQEYYRLRATLGPRPTRLPLYQAPWSDARGVRSPEGEIAAAIRQYSSMLAVMGLQPRAGVAQEVEEVTRVVEDEPGPFLAFCQGDQNGVGGCMRTGAGLRFFDFDCGGFRHALLEGMPARITWGGMVAVPARVVRRMDVVYRAELARACPAARGDATYHRAMVAAGAWWHIFHVVHRLPEALEGDRPRGPSSLRQQALAWIEAFAGLAAEFQGLPALGASARDLAARLRDLWPPEVLSLPVYPAFRDG